MFTGVLPSIFLIFYEWSNIPIGVKHKKALKIGCLHGGIYISIAHLFQLPVKAKHGKIANLTLTLKPYK